MRLFLPFHYCFHPTGFLRLLLSLALFQICQLESPSPARDPKIPEKMVRILANGDIVQDDDPRVRPTPQARTSSPGQVSW